MTNLDENLKRLTKEVVDRSFYSGVFFGAAAIFLAIGFVCFMAHFFL